MIVEASVEQPTTQTIKALKRVVYCTMCAEPLLASDGALSEHYKCSHQVVLSEQTLKIIADLSFLTADYSSLKRRFEQALRSANKKKDRKKRKELDKIIRQAASEAVISTPQKSHDMMDRHRRLPGSYGHGKR